MVIVWHPSGYYQASFKTDRPFPTENSVHNWALGSPLQNRNVQFESKADDF